MKKIYWIVGVIIVVIVIIILVSSPKTPTEKGPVRIGFLTFPSGPLANVGELTQKAANYAVEEVNAQGGINGRQVELIAEDYSYDAKKVIPAYEALKTRGLTIIDLEGSTAAAVATPLIRQDGNFSMTGISTYPDYTDGNPLTCRIAITPRTVSPEIIKLITAQFPKPRVALLVSANEYGKSMENTLKENLQKIGGTLVVESFEQAAIDFRTQITKFKSMRSQIDALVIINGAKTVEAMIKQIREQKLDIPMFSDYITIVNPSLLNRTLAEGIPFVDYDYIKEPQSDDEQYVLDFKEAYKKKNGDYPLITVASTYDAFRIMFEGLKNIKTISPKSLSDYLVNDLGEYNGVTGTITLNNDCEADRVTVNRIIKAGKLEVIK